MKHIGIIDKERNPFSLKSWIDQNYGLTYKSKRNRQDQLVHLIGKSVDEIKKLGHNFGKYPAFVGIRWGFVKIQNNILTPTEKWGNRFNLDEFGKIINRT